MSAVPFGLSVVIVLALTLFFVNKYFDMRKSWGLTFIVLCAWFLSFIIVVALPFDVSSTFYWNCVRNFYCDNPTQPDNVTHCNTGAFHNPAAIDNCNSNPNCTCTEPWSYISDSALPSFWSFCYWASQLLTWIILPMMESYLAAGDFTFWGKMKAALKENAIIYISAGVLLAGFFIYIAVKNHLDMDGLREVVIATSNTWSMFLLIVLLGFGLVDLPRYMWYRSNYDWTLKNLYFRVAKVSSEESDAKETLDEVYNKVRSVAGKIPAHDPLRPFINEVLRKCPFGEDGRAGSMAYTDYGDEGKVSEITLGSLVSLHKKVIKSQRILRRCDRQLHHTLTLTLKLEDIIKNKDSPDRRFRSSFKSAPKGLLGKYWPVVKWYWKIKIAPWKDRVFAVLGALLSIAIIWSEMVFGVVNPTLSIYAIIIHNIGHYSQYFDVEVVTLITLLYLSYAAYRVIFKIRLFNFFYMVPHQQTDTSSMLFAAMFLSRLTAPICLNYLGLCHLDSHVAASNNIDQETAFTQVIGHYDVVSFLKTVNSWYPAIMIFISVGTLFRLGARLTAMCGGQSFLDDDETSEDFVLEGKALATRERRKRTRALESVVGDEFEEQPTRVTTRKIDLKIPKEASKPSKPSTSQPRHGPPPSQPSRPPPDTASNPYSFSYSGIKSALDDRDDDDEELLPDYKLTKTPKPSGKPTRNLFGDM